MTIVLHDARETMIEKGFRFPADVFTEVLYADDTLLLHSSEAFLAAYMQEIERSGREYGLILNFNKVEALTVRTQHQIRNSDNSLVTSKDSLKYLGSTLHENGKIIGGISNRPR